MAIIHPDNLKQISSVCPVLGEKHAKLHARKCPKDLQSPKEKTLKITYYNIGDHIYVKPTDPATGCDISVMDILADKFDFKYELIHQEEGQSTFEFIKQVQFVLFQSKCG